MAWVPQEAFVCMQTGERTRSTVADETGSRKKNSRSGRENNERNRMQSSRSGRERGLKLHLERVQG